MSLPSPDLRDLALSSDDLALLSAPLLPVASSVLAIRPLTEGDARRASSTGPAPEPVRSIKSIRQSHHRAAQMIAGGVPLADVSRLTNYSPTHLDRLREDPAFQELMAHYTGEASVEMADFLSTAGDLSADLMAELRERLDEAPERLSTSTLIEAFKVVSDRAGRAPISRTVNTNVNIGIGERMLKARSRLQALPAPITVEVISDGE